MVTRVPATMILNRPITAVDRGARLKTRNIACMERLSTSEKVFTVAMLFYTAGAVVSLITDDFASEAASQSNPLDLTIKITLYTITLFYTIRWWRSFIATVWSIRWVLVPVLIAAFSVIWSQHPFLTFRGSAVLIATTVFGVYFGTRYTVPQQLRLLAWTFSLVVIASFLFAFFLPAYGIDQGVTFGDWRGVFIQKNGLAEAMVFAFFVFLFVPASSRSLLRWIGIAGSLTLLVLSGSATGIVVCAAIVATLPLYSLARARFTLVIPVSLLLCLLAAGSLLIMQSNADEALQLVNRSPDLTGRTEIWNAVLHSISKRPWLGYGFSAFWEGTTGESGSVLDAIGYTIGYSHNGFLDVLLQVGAVGLVAFIASYLLLWNRALALLSKATGSTAVWQCTFLVFLLLYNISEGGAILAQNSIYWVLYIATAVSLFPVYSRRICTD